MGVSLNGGTPKSSILIGFSIINHPFWGYPTILGNPHISKASKSWEAGDFFVGNLANSGRNKFDTIRNFSPFRRHEHQDLQPNLRAFM